MTTLEQIRQLALLGGSRREVEATIGRRMSEDERIAFDKAKMIAKLQEAKERAERQADPMSGADRKAKMIASRNELGEIPRVRHRRLRERCKYDLELFGWYYCRMLLDHRASEEIDRRLIQKMQQAILSGGQLAVEFTRSAGKTTWTEIAFVWAILYGHRHFPVCIAASKPLAKSIKNAVLAIIETSDAIAADFPAVPMALRAIGGVVQRASTITYHGRPVGYESSEMMFKLPMLRNDLGEPLEPACGAHFACRGVGASVRGLNELGDRPDFLLFDDPQTQKDARSATAVERLDRYIHGDALNLGANTATMAAFITITPQRFGDLACRIADKNLHPNWSVSTALRYWSIRYMVSSYRGLLSFSRMSTASCSVWGTSSSLNQKLTSMTTNPTQKIARPQRIRDSPEDRMAVISLFRPKLASVYMQASRTEIGRTKRILPGILTRK